jgi:hypothetical protein
MIIIKSVTKIVTFREAFGLFDELIQVLSYSVHG